MHAVARPRRIASCSTGLRRRHSHHPLSAGVSPASVGPLGARGVPSSRGRHGMPGSSRRRPSRALWPHRSNGPRGPIPALVKALGDARLATTALASPASVSCGVLAGHLSSGSSPSGNSQSSTCPVRTESVGGRLVPPGVETEVLQFIVPRSHCACLVPVGSVRPAEVDAECARRDKRVQRVHILESPAP